MRFHHGLLILGLVLCLFGYPADRAHGALPSRVLQFRDDHEKVAIGLGETQGVIRISSTGGLRILTDAGDPVVDFSKSLRITGGTISHRVAGLQTVWRVQILATRDGAAAMQSRHQVETTYSVPAYVVHTEPWFKVQVGDAPSAVEAEALKEKLMGLGYEGAWVTKAEVSILEEQPTDDAPLTPGFTIQDDAGNVVASSRGPQLVVVPVGQQPLALEMTNIPGRTYRGQLQLVALGQGKIQVINAVGIEDYLYGVVGAELYSKSAEDQAALAAQAVAARTYVIQSLGKHGAQGFDVCTTVHCQVYQGVERESEITRAAVDMTRGQILVYGGQAISAVYHSSSGGSTAGAEQVWATRYSGYLRPVPDEVIDPKTNSIVKLGQDRPGYNWEVSWQAHDLDGILRRYLETELSIRVPSTAILHDLRIGKQDVLGRVEELLISYTDVAAPGEPDQEYSVGKDKIRWVLRKPDNQILPSTRFELQVDRSGGKLQKVRVAGQGNGHGLGLSQTGALHMSRLGYGYQEILSHYYTDVTLLGLSQYYKDMESRVVWEQKGLVQSWAAILGPNQGIHGLTGVFQLSPAGDLIAYGTSGVEGGLWVFNAVSGKQARLLEEPVGEIAWKDDGSALAAVTMGQGGLRQLRVISIDAKANQGSDAFLEDLLAEAADIHSLGWLPGSDLVLFGQNGMIYGGQGGTSIPLFTEAKMPSIAPNGRQIAFWRRGAIWLYQLNAGLLQQLYSADGIRALLWSPDGEYLAISVDQDVVILRVSTGAIVTKFTGESPSWSAGGELLAYVHNCAGGLSDIYVLEMASLDKHILASSNQDGCAIHWSASGKTLAYNADGKLHLLTWR